MAKADFGFEYITNYMSVGTELVRKYNTSYVVYRYMRKAHIVGCDNYNLGDSLANALTDQTSLFGFPKIGDDFSDDLDTPGSIAPVRFKRITYDVKDPTTVVATLFYDCDPDTEPTYPDGFAWIDAMWHLGHRGYWRNTYVDVDKNPILVCSPRFDAMSNPDDILKATKAAACPQYIPQKIATIQYGVDADTFADLQDFQGSVNDGDFLSEPKGGWLCESVTGEPCSYTDVGNDDPAVPLETLYMVTIVLVQAGPTDIMKQTVGTPNSTKDPWAGLSYYEENHDGRLVFHADGTLTNGFPGDDQPFQEAISTLYASKDFTDLGPDEFGVQATEKA